jgi:predicted enzyme related to lactoylglutathione lyase
MTSPSNPVGYSELHTNDPARARAFYSELFGWKGDEQPTPMGPYTMFQDLLAGMTTSRDGIPVGWVPYVNVADVSTSTQRARALGAAVLRDCISIPEGIFSVVRDPTGAVLGLWQRK